MATAPQALLPYDVFRRVNAATVALLADLPFINLRSYNAQLDGITDDTAAWRNAIAALPNGGTLMVPAGTSLITDTITIATSRIRIIGAGEYASKIKFQPSAGKPCFLFDNGGGVAIAKNALIGFGFTSTDTTFQKIMVKFVDAAEIEISNLTSAETEWTGATSIGIQTMGRQTATIHDIAIAADIPIDIQPNPRFPNLCTDHFHFRDLYVIANNNPCINVAAGVVFSNTTFDGYQAWVKGTHGLSWAGNSGTTSSSLKICNARWEQSQSATGYIINIAGTTGVLGLTLENLNGGTGARGVLLRGVTYATLETVVYTGTGVALDVNSTVTNMRLANCYWGTVAGGATANLTGQALIWRFGLADTTQPAPTNAVYQSTSSGNPNISRINDVNMAAGSGVALANGGLFTLPLGLSGTERSLTVIVAAVNNTSGLPEGGKAIITMTGGAAALAGGTTNFGVGNVVGKLTVFWSNATTIQLFNQLGGGATVDYEWVAFWK